jgi:hypothetical protein
VRRAAWLALALAPALAAQTVTVSGTVTNAITHEPIAAATVRLWDSAHGIEEAQTDASGAFRIAKTPLGTYRVILAVKGFSAERTTVEIDANCGPLHLSMTPWPMLRGQVLDPERHPAEYVPVRMMLDGGVAMASTMTDSAGRYVLAQVQPGHYAVKAFPTGSPSEADGATELAPTFFPNVTEWANATHIALRPGDDLGGFDIVLQRVPVFRVAGKVVDDRGNPAAAVTVEAENAAATAVTHSDGTFQLPRVRPGNGWLKAKLVRDGVELRGFAEVLVAGRDVNDFTLRLAAPMELRGTMELDGKPAPEPGHAAVDPLDARGTYRNAEWKGAAFHIAGVYPGRYRLQVTVPTRMFANDVHLDSVRLGERDITADEFDAAPGMLPFLVVLKTGGGRVRGTVESGKGGIVVLVPKEERLRLPGLIVSTFFQGPQFTIDNLRQGEYYAFAVQEGSLNLGQMQDPAYAGPLLAGAPSVKVEDNSTATLTLLYVKLPSSQ